MLISSYLTDTLIGRKLAAPFLVVGLVVINYVEVLKMHQNV